MRNLSLWLSFGCILAGCQARSGPAIVTIEPTPSVEVVRPQRTTVERTLVLTGNLQPYHEARVYARIPGYLQSLTVDIGDSVAPGQLLGRIESPESASEATRRESLLNSRLAQEQVTEADIARARAVEREFATEVEASLAKEAIAEAAVTRARSQADLASKNLQRLELVYSDDPGSVAGIDLDTARSQSRANRSQWDEARAELALARKNSRAARLRVDSARAQTFAAEAQFQVQTRQTQVAEVELTASRTLASLQELRAPFRGVVTERNLDPGDLVQASNQNAQNRVSPILVIADVGRLRVKVEVPEPDAAWVRPGTLAQLELPGGTDLQSRVTRISRSLQSESKTMRAEIELENRKGLLQAGGTVAVRLRLESHPEVWAVPPAALQLEKGKASLWVVQSSVAHKQAVSVGFENERWAEISAGLSGAEEVVVVGGNKISGKGGPVRVLQADQQNVRKAP